MIKSNVSSHWVKRSTLAWLMVAQIVCVLPLFIYLPLWLPGLWLLTFVWRIQAFRGAWPLPTSKIKTLLGLSSIGGLVLSYGGFGLEPLAAFLVISFVLKILEVRYQKDVLLVLHVAFITVAAQFLFFQTIFIAVYALVCVLILLTAWNNVYRRRELSIGKQLIANANILAQSVPVMLILFVVLPRVGSLWNVPIPNSTGTTGFSDTMTPGDFSSLSQSREVAFRVSFDDDNEHKPPPQSDWYWRGLVMDEFDGRSWRAVEGYVNRTSAQEGPPDFWQLALPDSENYHRYSILMEPHQQTWLFSMMAPVHVESSSGRIYFSENYLTQSIRPVTARSQYHVVSTGQYLASPNSLAASIRSRSMQIPRAGNPRARKLAQQWQQQGLSESAIVSKALNMYTEAFSYTLKPPPLGADSVDEFLFFTRRGFCEHFSSSFVFLMRAAGIPARVVVGYQGGEYNPSENYIIVRQSAAHAWAEIWREGQGWIRVDPTAAVSPSRIEQGLEASLSAEEQTLIRGVFNSGIFSRVQLRLDAFSYSWHRWVLGYDSSRQASILKKIIGGVDVWRIALLFVGSISCLLMVYFLYLMWNGRRQDLSPEVLLYQRLLKPLAKKGFQPYSGESPEGFITRVVKENPHWSSQLQDIQDMFYRLAYAGETEYIKTIEKKIQKLKLGK